MIIMRCGLHIIQDTGRLLQGSEVGRCTECGPNNDENARKFDSSITRSRPSNRRRYRLSLFCAIEEKIPAYTKTMSVSFEIFSEYVIT